MRSFPVEEDVVALVWAKAKPAPFEQLSFSDALRRILADAHSAVKPVAQPPANLTAKLAADSGRALEPRTRHPTADEMLAELGQNPTDSPDRRGRAPKADLRELVRLGYLKDGQDLTFVDFRGKTHPKGKAKVSGDDLLFADGRRYSMSALAGLLLKQHGYVGESVRGPEHWMNSEGTKVRELWETALLKRDRK